MKIFWDYWFPKFVLGKTKSLSKMMSISHFVAQNIVTETKMQQN